MKSGPIQNTLGVLLFLLGAAVIAEWMFHMPWMAQIYPDFVGMTASAALCFMLVGIALIAPVLPVKRHTQLQQFIGGVLIAFSSLVLVDIILDIDLVIDFPPFSRSLEDSDWPGRMAPNTCLGFILSGIILILGQQVRKHAIGLAVQAATFALLAVGLTGLVGYFLKLESFYSWFHIDRMGLDSAVGMMLAGTAFWVSWYGAEWNQTRNRFFKEDEHISFVGGAILVVVTLTTGLSGFVAYQKSLDKAMRESLQLSLNNNVRTFQVVTTQAAINVENTAHRPGFTLYTQRLVTNLHDTEARDRLREIGVNILTLGVTGIIIQDNTGREILRLGHFVPTSDISVDLGLPISASLLWNGAFYLRASARMFDSEGNPMATLIAEQPLPSVIGEAFSRTSNFGNTGEMRLCAAKGQLLQCFPQRFNQRVETSSRYNAQGKLLPASYAVDGQSGVIETQDYRGHNVIAAYAPLNTTGFGMVVKQDTEEFYAPLRDQLQHFLPLLAVFIVGGVMLLRFQIKPIMRKVLTSEHDLFREKERLRITLASIGDAVITTDTEGNVTYLNPVAEMLTGWLCEDAKGLPLLRVFQIFNEETGEAVKSPVELVLQSGKICGLANHTMLRRRDNTECSIEDAAAPIFDQDNQIIGIVMVFHDVTSTRKMTAEISYQATHDGLTGLLNRREFERRLELALQRAESDSVRHSLLYLDLDQFKVVNDTCGHIAGDELLRQLASVFNQHIRQNDALARLGGDEFGVLLNNCSPGVSLEIAETLRRVICDFHFVWQDKTFPIGVSIGMVNFGDGSLSLEKILSAADAACYVAKDKGRNRIHMYHADDTELAKRHGEMSWISRIQTALDENRFCLYTQKIIELGSPAVQGEHHEVLIRMRDEQGDLVPPMAFIPAAERYNLMPALDRWVIQTAFAQYSEASRRGDRPIHTRAINLSGASIGDTKLFDFIHEQFKLFNVPPHTVCFEVTETSAIANLGQAATLIRKLKGLGCRFALDDFGSGMSSFAYLKHLPVDFLKIDGSFVKDMLDDPIDHAMVKAINNIGHVMGIKTIAEYAENRQILEELERMGVDFAQGFGIEKPVPI